ncbi:neoverrucotoxin subunit alpha-like protein [Labeo rohita]|uniref:Neoverrucotoxin subunit alpha-like protein n=1 Tax=Labeo rohita TaxID=84645 RepID=A0A498LZJ4_LABRO|nr:neoverrucotoxin subunit alpha-like protein [Labeo rohita]
MASLLVLLKQPNCIYICAFLWLAYLAVGNAEGMLEPEANEIGILPEETIRAARRIVKTRALPSDTIKVAALGRPLFPGTLYDSRKDSFLPGVTLWDRKSLSEDLDSRPKPQTYTDFSSSDSLSSKLNLLDLSASLKTSFLGGLVEVGGSAKYLHDTKSLNHQSRITVYYSVTTRYEWLTMSHLRKITYPEVFDQKSATHVVMGVLYGAQAFMVFDRTLSEAEDKQRIEGELNAMVEKIRKFSAEGNAALQMTYAEKKIAEKITCTFHGDFHLQQNPTTYMEALNVYKQLPALLKDNPQNEVPIKVWLYPLHLLNATAARVEREISTSVAFAIEDIMEKLGEAERTYKDLSENTLVKSFSDIKERLHSFHSSFSMYKKMLLKAVGRVLPAVRGGEKEEKSLEDILKIHRSSPFNADMLNQWLNDAKAELDILSSLTKQLEGVQIVDSNGLNTILLNSDFPGVVCLTFTSLDYEDPYLSALKVFLETDMFKELDGEQRMVSVAPVKKWFKDSEFMEKLRFNIHLFKGFLKLYEGQAVRFIISAISDTSNPGSSIYLYKHGKLSDKQKHYIECSVVTEDGRGACKIYRMMKRQTSGGKGDDQMKTEERDEDRTEYQHVNHRYHRRKKSKSPPPHMSDLRIVLLGWSVSENSDVGNFILGRAAFDSEAPPDVVERVAGRLKDRHVIIINSPQLLQTNISDHQITQTVRECVHLSDPGPHVIVLLLKHEPCSAEDQGYVEKMFEDIVKMNDGRHLDCAEDSQYFTVEKQAIQKQGVKLNLVVCGSDAILKSSISEQIQQRTDRRSDVELHGRLINLVELPALIRLSEEEVMRQTLHCVSLSHPGVHVFLLVIPDAPINNEDKAEMEDIQRIFSSRINKHIMILIKQNSERQTAELNKETQSVIQSFGGRRHFIGPKTQVSTLMENIDQMLEENSGEFFSTEMFIEAQTEKLVKYEEMKKKIHSLETHLLLQGIEKNQFVS